MACRYFDYIFCVQFLYVKQMAIFFNFFLLKGKLDFYASISVIYLKQYIGLCVIANFNMHYSFKCRCDFAFTSSLLY